MTTSLRAVTLGFLALAATACGSSSPTAPSELTADVRPPAAAACTAVQHQPNYVQELGLLNTVRYASWPVRAYIEEPELTRRGYSDARRVAIVHSIMQGLSSWARRSGGKIGAIVATTDPSEATLTVVFRNLPGNQLGGVTHESSNGAIRVSRMTINADFIETRVGRDLLWEHTPAHEMGHALGIVGHPSTTESVMFAGVGDFKEPQLIDINSMLVKYGCP
jgi:predicted Zn-dependent protease